MAVDLRYLEASDGTGSAVLAHVDTARIAGATTLSVDSVDGWSDYFIATSGTLNASGYIIESGKTEFRGHLDAGNIIIDSFEPGFTDIGNTTSDVVIIKQTTGWANAVTEAMQVSHNNDGTLKTAVKQQLVGWTPASLGITGATYNGNRSYTLATSVDNRTLLSPGMRLQTTRNVPAPTQCATFDGTNDFFSKSSPAGMTFTDDFVVSAWIKLTSYTTAATIVSRYNGSSGWNLQIDTSGRLNLVGFNAAQANNSYVVAYPAVPLNRWVHVAVQLDMSAFTATPTTSYVMMDGVDVPAQVVRNGSNPTSLIQAGDFQIGATNSTTFFPGKIAQVAVFSAKVTQATMRGYISQGLLGTETNLASAYSLNNALTDLNTTNANNLTANGGVLATTADSPFGSQAGGTISSTLDYGIVQTVDASTIVTQVAEGCTIPTTGGVASATYSTYKVPFGFPSQKAKWTIETHNKATALQASPVAGTWYNIFNTNILAPIGEWNAGYKVLGYVNRASGDGTMAATLSTTTSTDGFGSDFHTQAGHLPTTDQNTTLTIYPRPMPMSSATTIYLNLRTQAVGVSGLYIVGGTAPTVVSLENALL